MTARRCRSRHAACSAALVIAALLEPALANAQLHMSIEHEGEPRVERDAPADEAETPPTAASKPPVARADAARPPADHVPPAPPAHPFDAMPMAQMDDVMGMDDDAVFSMVLLDRLERDLSGSDSSTNWNARAWLGRDFDKLWIKTEGEHARGETRDADVEALWGHAIAPYWDSQLGVRHDFGAGRDRTWLAVGAQGLAPYWFDIEATAYVSDGGRTALRLETEYDLLLSQRLILQPRFEVNAYGKSDFESRIGAGVSDAEFGLRLRYEIRREFAPYVGVEWRRAFAATAGLARDRGDDVFDSAFVFGVRAWF